MARKVRRFRWAFEHQFPVYLWRFFQAVPSSMAWKTDGFRIFTLPEFIHKHVPFNSSELKRPLIQLGSLQHIRIVIQPGCGHFPTEMTTKTCKSVECNSNPYERWARKPNWFPVHWKVTIADSVNKLFNVHASFTCSIFVHTRVSAPHRRLSISCSTRSWSRVSPPAPQHNHFRYFNSKLHIHSMPNALPLTFGMGSM